MNDPAAAPDPADLSRHAAGASLGDPGGAGRLIVLATGAEGDADSTEVEAVCEPGPAGVEERSFSAHEVRFEVLEGRLTIGIDGDARALRAGEALTLPAGTPHRIWVEEDRPAARFIWRMRPAAPHNDLLELIFGDNAARSAT